MHSMSRVPQMTITVKRPGPPPNINAEQNTLRRGVVRVANKEAMHIQALSRAATPDVSGAGAMLTRLSRGLPVDPMASIYAGAQNEQARKMTGPSRQGVGMSGDIMRREVTRGLGLAGALGGTAACTSTGARVAQGILGATSGVLSALGSGGFRSEQATAGGGATGSNMNADTQRNLAISGAAINMVGSIYTGVCDARMAARGIESPAATQTLTDWRTAAMGTTQQVQSVRTVGAQAAAPQVSAPPAESLPPAAEPQAAASEGSKTWMYVAGGVAIAGLLAFAVRR